MASNKRSDGHNAPRGYVLLIVMVIGIAASLAALSLSTTRGGAQIAAVHSELADRSAMIAEAGMNRAVFYVNDALNNSNDFDAVLDTDLETAGQIQTCGSAQTWDENKSTNPTTCANSGADADLRPDTVADTDDLQEWTDGFCEIIGNRRYTCVRFAEGRYCVRFEDDDDDGVETTLWSQNSGNNELFNQGCGTPATGCKEGNAASASLCGNHNAGARQGYRDRNRAIWVIAVGIYPDTSFDKATHKTTLRRYHMAPRYPSSAGIKIKGNLNITGGGDWLACSDIAGVEIDGTATGGGGDCCVSGRSAADSWTNFSHCRDIHDNSDNNICQHVGNATGYKELHMKAGDGNNPGNRIPLQGLPLNTPGPTLPDMPSVWNNANEWVDWSRPCTFWVDTGNPGGGMGVTNGTNVLWFWDANASRGPGGAQCSTWENSSPINSAFPGPPDPARAHPQIGTGATECLAGDYTPACWAGCWTPLLFAENYGPPNDTVTDINVTNSANTVFPHAYIGGVTTSPNVPLPEGTNYAQYECFAPMFRQYGGFTPAGVTINIPPTTFNHVLLERPVGSQAWCRWKPINRPGVYETCGDGTGGTGNQSTCYYYGYSGYVPNSGVGSSTTWKDPMNQRLAGLGINEFAPRTRLFKPDWASECTVKYPPVSSGLTQATYSSTNPDTDGGTETSFGACDNNDCMRWSTNSAMWGPLNGENGFLFYRPQSNADVRATPAGVYYFSNGYAPSGSGWSWNVATGQAPHPSIGKTGYGVYLNDGTRAWPLMTVMSSQTMSHQFGSEYRYGIGQSHPGTRHGGEDALWGVNATWVTGGLLDFQGSAGPVAAAGGIYAEQGASWSGGAEYYVYGPLYSNSDFSKGGGTGFYWIYNIRFDQPPTGGYGGINASQTYIAQ